MAGMKRTSQVASPRAPLPQGSRRQGVEGDASPLRGCVVPSSCRKSGPHGRSATTY